MNTIDYIVLAGYFLVLGIIGVICMLRVKKQEDYFLGGRSFGKIIQAFAAFGAGTGSNDPVTIGRTTFTSGLSGIWGVMLWLFVTPFYWFFGVWYRRMRHLTLGDWFVERYQSRGMGAAYTLFAICFYMMYLSVMFSAISKVCAPLVGMDMVNLPWLSDQPIELQYILTPLVGIVVIFYGVLGGLRAAYWTDLIQGVLIILLSILLIPFGLNALVEKFGDPETMGMMDGFRIMHEQIPGEFFQILDSPKGGEFPIHFIIAITVINLVGIVVQPHFIATGGGSAKTENSARVGLVVGNFMKRFCTIGWALTALIVLAMFADSPTLSEDPDRVWGVATLEILGPLNIGLVGLMVACLLAAMMSSADCYMLVTSACVVRNVYAAYLKPQASEKECILIGRLTGLLIIVGGVVISLNFMDVFEQLKISWEIPIVFAAPFWLGVFWRKANTRSAWGTIAFSALFFFVIPMALPSLMSDMRTSERWTQTNVIETTIITREAAPSDVAKGSAAIQVWQSKSKNIMETLEGEEQAAALAALGSAPAQIELGMMMQDKMVTGGKPIFWTGSVSPVIAEGASPEIFEEISRSQNGNIEIIRQRYKAPLEVDGRFNLDFLIYSALGLDLKSFSNATLETLRLPPKVILPFIVMVLLSYVTRMNPSGSLDRYFAKMRTPVNPDPMEDQLALESAFNVPENTHDKKWFPNSNWEFSKPNLTDVLGFVGSFILCFVVIWMAVWVANIGS